MKRRSDGRNWDALKAEWLQSAETLNEFRIRHRIANGKFYEAVKKGNWKDAKLEIENKAISKIQSQQADKLAEQWDRQKELWKGVEGAAARILTAKNKEGAVMDPGELAQVSMSLYRSLVSQRLLAGMTTGKLEANVSGDLHSLLVAIVAKMEATGHDTVGALDV